MIDRSAGRGAVGSIWESQTTLDAFLAQQPERRKNAESRGISFDDQETREILFADLK